MSSVVLFIVYLSQVLGTDYLQFLFSDKKKKLLCTYITYLIYETVEIFDIFNVFLYIWFYLVLPVNFDKYFIQLQQFDVTSCVCTNLTVGITLLYDFIILTSAHILKSN